MKKEMVNLMALLIILSSISCYEIDFSHSERVSIEGRILDENNNPLKNIPIEVYAIHSCSNISDFEFQQSLIASDITDENGVFKAFTMLPLNEVVNYIAVNKGYDLLNDNEVSSAKPYCGKLIYFSKSEISNNRFNSNDVKIKTNKTRLNINFIIDANDYHNLYYSIRNKNNINAQIANTIFKGCEYQTDISIKRSAHFEMNSEVVIPVIAKGDDFFNINDPIYDTIYAKMDSLIKNITINL